MLSCDFGDGCSEEGTKWTDTTDGFVINALQDGEALHWQTFLVFRGRSLVY